MARACELGRASEMTARPVPKRHWRSYGNDPLPTGAEAALAHRHTRRAVPLSTQYQQLSAALPPSTLQNTPFNPKFPPTSLAIV
jgi:hypothetical protein